MSGSVARRPGRTARTAAATAPRDWSEANQRDLMRAVARVRRDLEWALDGEAARPGNGEAAGPSAASAASRTAPEARYTAEERAFAPYALERIVAAFGLSTFERDVLVVCAGVELSAGFADLVARLGATPDGAPRPTFGLALAALRDAHWSALAPDSPLRRWRLVEVGGPGLTEASVRIDERVLHALAGLRTLDERLAAYVERPPDGEASAAGRAGSMSAAAGVEGTRAVAAGGEDAATAVAALLRGPLRRRAAQVAGGDATRRRSVAGTAAAAAGMGVLRLRIGDLPEAPGERFVLATLLGREALLGGNLVVLDAGSDAAPADEQRVAAFLQAYPPAAGAVLVTAPEPLGSLAGIAPAITLPAATGEERIERWRDALGAAAASLNGTLEALATTFELESDALAAAAEMAAAAETAAGGDLDVPHALWDAARGAARPRMDGLAQRIDPAAGWDDLVLPPEQIATLRQIALHVRRRHRVHEEWGFAEKSARGLGIAALFAGPSGTGKTMAAEVLARELRLDLYRIDLAAVVSKYIGETEKNLARVFRAAEGSGGILLFDEADALFGKRSEVRDSHDRYANVEIGYLLQRMETYRGLAILTTNAKDALDPAFLRRLRFVVTFPFPDAALRARIWRGVFPPRTPTDGLLHERLAQLNASGGQIRNIALGAAFLAADAGEPVSMRHLAAAARTEYAKHERQPSDAELRGWA